LGVKIALVSGFEKGWKKNIEKTRTDLKAFSLFTAAFRSVQGF
jgi:hypothetical protein